MPTSEINQEFVMERERRPRFSRRVRGIEPVNEDEYSFIINGKVFYLLHTRTGDLVLY